MKRKQLEWWDVVFLSLILFGGAIFNSNYPFFSGIDYQVIANATEFNAWDNIYGIFTILIELSIAFLYLKWRHFDFKQWKYQITGKKTIWAIVIFVLSAICLDLADIAWMGWKNSMAFVGSKEYLNVIKGIDLSLLAFSLLNGFYEEIFFLGICFSTKNSQKWFVFIYSLIIRFSFHTYQGIVPALEIGVILGTIFYILYKKSDRNLYPFMLAHSLADIIGASILYLL